MRNVPLLSPAKSRILTLLRPEQRAAGDIASALDIQVSAVRKHLDRLRQLGIVDARFVRGGRGRPKKLYFLTEEGKELFPRQYDTILNAVLTNVVRDRGPEYMESIFRRVAAEIARAADPHAGSRARVARLVELLNDLGFEASARQSKGGCTITSRNCPVLKAATLHRELVCRGLHAEIIRAAMGHPSVTRARWIVDGDPFCTHLVRPSPEGK